MLQKIFLIDHSATLITAWQQAFLGCDNVEVFLGDFFSHHADAMVSPANSFGIMDGGLDLAIRYELGFDVEQKVQKAILDDFYGELPVGAAVIVETNHEKWPFLIAAPTMRVPENISKTLNAYVAFRAVLLAIQRHNETSHRKINSFVCSGLGTGVGGVDPQKCAQQMHAAFLSMSKPARIASYNEIRSQHKKLHTI